MLSHVSDLDQLRRSSSHSTTSSSSHALTLAMLWSDSRFCWLLAPTPWLPALSYCSSSQFVLTSKYTGILGGWSGLNRALSFWPEIFSFNHLSPPGLQETILVRFQPQTSNQIEILPRFYQLPTCFYTKLSLWSTILVWKAAKTTSQQNAHHFAVSKAGINVLSPKLEPNPTGVQTILTCAAWSLLGGKQAWLLLLGLTQTDKQTHDNKSRLSPDGTTTTTGRKSSNR